MEQPPVTGRLLLPPAVSSDRRFRGLLCDASCHVAFPTTSEERNPAPTPPEDPSDRQDTRIDSTGVKMSSPLKVTL